MNTTCPTCNKPVDPLRSRAVAVKDGKVTAYCSKECMAAGQAERSGPVVTSAKPVAPPAASVPAKAATPSTGVPLKVGTPVSGVPIKTPVSAATPSAGIPRPRTPPAGVPLESGPVIEVLHEPASGVVTSAKDERVDNQTGPRAKHPDEIPIAAFWTADKEKEKSAPVKVKSTKDPTGSGKRDDTLEKWAMGDETVIRKYSERSTSEHDQIAPPHRSRVPILIIILLLAGAGGFFVYQYLSKKSVAAATDVGVPVAPPVVEPVKPAPPPAPPPVDVTAALDRARTILHAYLKATSPRVQRLAAAALARTGDKDARVVLGTQLGVGAEAGAVVETSDITKLDIAYSLARSGDKRGGDALAAALRSERAEARDEAARLLVLLGDQRGVPHLVDLLEISQRRLGAAEHLAHVADPKALKVLDGILADPKALPDDKARATIALGHAGRADVAPALRGMLADSHFNAFAAAALARLKDPAARPVLEKHLEFASLRVGAARALRRLDPDLDAKPLVPHLLDALKSGKDIEQVQAAEAILLLGGPATWSEYE